MIKFKINKTISQRKIQGHFLN